jgi:hypothetical protein
MVAVLRSTSRRCWRDRRIARPGGTIAGGEAGRYRRAVAVLNPTPRELLLDQKGRPYFLWDVDMTLERFQELLRTDDRETRAYLVGKLMRQAKPDDVFSFVTESEIRELWPDVQPYLGRTRGFWHWLMDAWARG